MKLINLYLSSTVQREKNQINKIRHERGEKTTVITESKKIVREYNKSYMPVNWAT